MSKIKIIPKGPKPFLKDIAKEILAGTRHKGKMYWRHKDFPTEREAIAECNNLEKQEKDCIYEGMIVPKTDKVFWRVYARTAQRQKTKEPKVSLNNPRPNRPSRRSGRLLVGGKLRRQKRGSVI